MSGWVKAGLVLVFAGLCVGGIFLAFSAEQKCPAE